MRRLPIFLVVDISESMVGNNLYYMQESISQLIRKIRQDPYALESVYISVIAFSGVAGTLVPLTELMSFYPPRLPIGSGTSIGAALHQVMDEIDDKVIKSTADKKGDWRPLVYVMSDGAATDDPRSAIQRWKNEFLHRAKLVNIGVGSFADLSILQPISELSFRLEDDDLSNTYRTLVSFIEDSILSQSKSCGVAPLTLSKEQLENTAISLIKNEQEAKPVDENYAIITGLCRKAKLPYLMKYEHIPNTPIGMKLYQYAGVYPLDTDYFSWSDNRANENKIAASQLFGAGGCPHCGASCGLACCDCGQIFCVDNDGEVECPGCHQTIYLSSGDSEGDFNITRSRG